MVAGILESESTILIAQRGCEEHFGQWEFPGGKIEDGESPPQALKREILEELGVEVTEFSPLGEVLDDYPTKQVRICFFVVSEWRGSITGRAGQITRWVQPSQLDSHALTEADQVFWRAFASSRYC